MEGGPKMVNIDMYIDSIKLGWVKRLVTGEFSNWKVIPKKYFNAFGKDFLIFRMNVDSLNSLPGLKNLQKFYYEIVKTWVMINHKKVTEPSNFRTVRQQIIWGNQFIKIRGKCILFDKWLESDIVYINDIIDDSGEISENFILQKLHNKSNWISEICQVRKAIPNTWLSKLKQDDSRKTRVQTNEHIGIYSGKNVKQNIENLNTKNFKINILIVVFFLYR